MTAENNYRVVKNYRSGETEGAFGRNYEEVIVLPSPWGDYVYLPLPPKEIYTGGWGPQPALVPLEGYSTPRALKLVRDLYGPGWGVVQVPATGRPSTDANGVVFFAEEDYVSNPAAYCAGNPELVSQGYPNVAAQRGYTPKV